MSESLWEREVVVQSFSRVWLCDPTDCSMLGFPVLHFLPEFAHVCWVGDAIQPSYPLLPSSPVFSLSPGPFPLSCLFTSGGQVSGASASASVLLMNIQGWFPWRLTGCISLLSKGLLRVFSSTTVQKHQFFSAQLSLQYNSYIHTWLLVKLYLWLDGPLLTK